jgi:DNA-binding transcriptional LysR family regulator
MALDLRHLRYFVAVAEEGQITRAAERLGMQQPPLSQQIKLIEHHIDAQLFLRTPRGVVLTQAGRALLDEARATLAQFDRALETTRRTARGEQGRLSLGMTPTAAFHPLVPRTVREFRERYPRVLVTLDEWLSDGLLERLRDQRMDAAFIRNTVTDPSGLTITPLLDEIMVAALPSDHRLAQSRDDSPLDVAMLAEEVFVLIGPPGSGIHDRTVAACQAAGFTPRISQIAPRITSTLGLIAAGLGVSVVPMSMQRIVMDGVAYRRLKGPVTPRAILSLASRKEATSAILRRFNESVRRAATAYE